MALKRLFKSETGDITISGSDRTWKVHSVIVAPRCEFLKNACEGPFKVRRVDLWGYSSCPNNRQESQTRTVQMLYDDSVALDSLLEFLYTGSYTEMNNTARGTNRTDIEWNEILKMHAEVFTLADKYGVVTLKELAKEGITVAFKGLTTVVSKPVVAWPV